MLTVHGAKGLEAPIVFLVDTTFLPDFKDRLLWHEPPGLPLWRMGSKGRERLSGAAFEQARRRQLQEQRRLLYVGLTRAREHLIVAGCQRKTANDDTWHALVEAALPAARRGADRDAADRPGSRATAGASPTRRRLPQASCGCRWRHARPIAPAAAALAAPQPRPPRRAARAAQPVARPRRRATGRAVAAAGGARRPLPPRPADPSPAAEPARTPAGRARARARGLSRACPRSA